MGEMGEIKSEKGAEDRACPRTNLLLAATAEVDLGAFLYAMRRLPAGVWQTAVIVMGQEAQVFERLGVGRIEEWDAVEAPARRHHGGTCRRLPRS